jgi:Cys-tRNA(Pro)/Cys-tRNA(Cys) deacylase
MVGEFHAAPPDKRGLWNPEFRPLWSPVPMLVIRHMVPTDVLFLKDDARLFREYARIYGGAVPERFRPDYDAAAERFGLAPGADDTTPRGSPRVMQALADAGVHHRVHRHDDHERPIRVPQDFADALGIALSRICKTLFVRCRDSGRYFLIVGGMDRRIDLRAFASAIGCGRLEMADLAELQRHVGHPPTSVCPIGVDGIPVHLDERLLAHETILVGSGVPRVEVEIAPDDLAMLCGATIATMP